MKVFVPVERLSSTVGHFVQAGPVTMYLLESDLFDSGTYGCHFEFNLVIVTELDSELRLFGADECLSEAGQYLT